MSLVSLVLLWAVLTFAGIGLLVWSQPLWSRPVRTRQPAPRPALEPHLSSALRPAPGEPGCVGCSA